jgi:hypothetical protein
MCEFTRNHDNNYVWPIWPTLVISVNNPFDLAWHTGNFSLFAPRQALLRDGVLEGPLQQHQLRPRSLRTGPDPGHIRHCHGTGERSLFLLNRAIYRPRLELGRDEIRGMGYA